MVTIGAISGVDRNQVLLWKIQNMCERPRRRQVTASIGQQNIHSLSHSREIRTIQSQEHRKTNRVTQMQTNRLRRRSITQIPRTEQSQCPSIYSDILCCGEKDEEDKDGGEEGDVDVFLYTLVKPLYQM